MQPLTVTIFGAESTGKTTLSHMLADTLRAQWVYEFARPFLEMTKQSVTVDSMTAIWHGQAVAQAMATGPVVIQDTDLFSTVGYWQFPHWRDSLGSCPKRLIAEAQRYKSGLYIITPSNIPFETDTLRTGGGVREGSDEYWMMICEQYHLNYVVLRSADRQERLHESLIYIRNIKEYLCAD
jgi:HTH-type transcriptional repressor of NAD biosynthesis genes